MLDCDRISRAQLDVALTALRREALLGAKLAIIANIDRVLGDESQGLKLELGNFIDGFDGPLAVTTTRAGVDIGSARSVVRIPWRVPNSEVRRRLWESAAARHGYTVSGDISDLAFRYDVGPAAILRAVESCRLQHIGATELDASSLLAGLRQNIAERLAGVAQRVEVHQSWHDLVVSNDTSDLILALVGRVRHAQQVLDDWGYRRKIARGTGVAALFSGPPGTGKTMVAGLIAKELGLELYQVDLGNVVSKWIGETEKNLARVFDAAEDGHALLLFDEADALFAKRSSDVKSATDRYANLEVNYLLQRVEAFGGVTILTTNLETAIDPALKRRLAGHVVFANPDDDERSQLWKRQCSTGTAPLSKDVDFDDLAREFQHMSGANIRNAAIAAAFLAAGEGANQITREHLVRAARAEYRSMGRVLSEVGTKQRGRL